MSVLGADYSDVFIYAALTTDGSILKIGSTCQLAGRIGGLRVQSRKLYGQSIDYIAAWRVGDGFWSGRNAEEDIRKLFKQHLAHGTDWYHATPELIHYVKTHNGKFYRMPKVPLSFEQRRNRRIVRVITQDPEWGTATQPEETLPVWNENIRNGYQAGV